MRDQMIRLPARAVAGLGMADLIPVRASISMSLKL